MFNSLAALLVPYKYLLIGLGILGLFGAGVLVGHNALEPTVVEKEVEKRVEVQVAVKGDTQIVYRDRIVTHTTETQKAPDGTVTTKEVDKTEEKAKDIDKKETVLKSTDTQVDTSSKVETPPEEGFGGDSIGIAVGSVVGGVVGFFATGGLGTHAGAAFGGCVGGAVGSFIGDLL